MLRKVSTSLIQTRGVKKVVNVNWVKPEYVPAYKPEKSGDLEPLPSIPPSTIIKEYALSDEIKDAPEIVKKLFTAEFLGKKEYHKLVREELISRVKRHQYDECTSETKIARMTATIRCLQELMEKYPRNVRVKQVVQELIDKRKQRLKFLRQYDYKKFEWLLAQLNIEYKGYPESANKLTRKQSLTKLTEMHCEDIRNKKLDDYRNLLESQQGPFLKDKLEALKFIRSEQIDLQLPVTVNEKDIKAVEEQLKEWTVKDEMKRQAKNRRRNLIADLD